MFFRRLLIRIRIAFIVLSSLFLLSAIGGIIYLNNQGLNAELRGHISDQLEKKGVYVTFESLKYKFSQGLVVEEVTVYTDATHTTKTAYLPSLIVNMDKTKLLRGKSKINSLELADGSLEIPINVNNPESDVIKLEEVNGKIEFIDGTAIVSDNLTAIYEGIEVKIDCHLWQKKEVTGTPDPDAAEKREKAYSEFLSYLHSWKWEDSLRPTINLSLKGDINDSEQIRAIFDLKAPSVTYEKYGIDGAEKYEVNELDVSGEFSHNLLTINHLHFFNDGRDAEVVADYDFANRNGKFDLNSTIQIQEFVSTFFGRDILKDITISGASRLSGSGSFELPTEENPETKISIMGNAEITKFNYLGSDFDLISSDFSWKDGNIYLNDLLAQNVDGELTGRILVKGDYVTYDVTSDLPIRSFDPFIKDGKDLEKALSKIKLDPESKLKIKSHGIINAKDLTDWKSTGSVYISKVGFRGVDAESFASDFNWENGILNLDNIHLIHETGELKGSVVANPEEVTFSVQSNLRPETYLPLLAHNKNAQDWINKVNPKGKEIYVSSVGTVNRSDLKIWDAHGELAINHLEFEGVPMKQLKFGYDINRKGLKLDDVTMLFDYTNYPLRKKYGGPVDGFLKVNDVDIDFLGHTVKIGHAKGTAYPAPVVRMFVESPVAHVETYQFRGPPSLSATGIFGISKDTASKTNFNVKVSGSRYPMNYTFLDGNLRLNKVLASVTILDKRVKVDNISFNTLTGRAAGNIDVRLPTGRDETYTGFFQWQQIDFRLLGQVYKFDQPEPGKLQGNIRFSGQGGDVRKFNSTKGTISLTKGNIFSVPLFGPISMLLNPFIPGKANLNERIKVANANFIIKNGILYTNDINCPTPSLSILGEGWIDLNKQTIDITMRVNFRGLISLPMLPVKLLEMPIKLLRTIFTGKKPGKEGLLQFRGVGTYKDPKWRMVPFQMPRDKNNLLFKPPKAILIPE